MPCHIVTDPIIHDILNPSSKHLPHNTSSKLVSFGALMLTNVTRNVLSNKCGMQGHIHHVCKLTLVDDIVCASWVFALRLFSIWMVWGLLASLMSSNIRFVRTVNENKAINLDNSTYWWDTIVRKMWVLVFMLVWV